jgi:hypothetical protein
VCSTLPPTVACCLSHVHRLGTEPSPHAAKSPPLSPRGHHCKASRQPFCPNNRVRTTVRSLVSAASCRRAERACLGCNVHTPATALSAHPCADITRAAVLPPSRAHLYGGPDLLYAPSPTLLSSGNIAVVLPLFPAIVVHRGQTPLTASPSLCAGHGAPPCLGVHLGAIGVPSPMPECCRGDPFSVSHRSEGSHPNASLSKQDRPQPPLTTMQSSSFRNTVAAPVSHLSTPPLFLGSS